MARIPLVTAQRGLDTGPLVQYPDGSPVGDALVRAGGALQGVAFRVQQKQDQHDEFLRGIGEQEFSQDKARMEETAIQNSPEDGSGLHDSVYGQLSPDGKVIKPGEFDALFDKYLAKMPASQREMFAAKREVYRMQGSNRMAQAQYDQEQAFYKVKIGQTQDQIINSILFSDPNDTKTFEAFKQQGLDIISKSGLPDLAKDAAIQKWKGAAATAFWQAKVAKDPNYAASGKAKADLGLAQREATGGDAVSTVVNKIIGVESGGNPNAKNRNSSASGTGQFIDSTWVNMIRQHRPDIAAGKSAAQIIALKSDPALGREMTEAYTRDNAQYLTNRGVRTTAGNLYLAHFLGPAGAVEVLKAEPNTPITNVVGGDVVKANPFLVGKTAADTAAWAAKKMGSAVSAPPDPTYADIPPDARLALGGQADKIAASHAVDLRAGLDAAVSNAPVAIMNTGQYSGQLPTRDQFVAAYGDQGDSRYDAFQSSVEASRQAYSMQTMPEDQIAALVKKAEPGATGDNAEVDLKHYQTIKAAADATLKAREADPVSYVQRMFPNVQQAWQSAGGNPAGYKQAIAATLAAQDQLGVKNPQIYPSEIVKDGVDKFKDESKTQDQRIGTVAQMLFATDDPAQRRAIFDQMVKAGLPDTTEGAFNALARGDTGAADRLFQAAMIDPSKLPGKSPETPDSIKSSIQSDVMDAGQIGDIYYGLSDGSTENLAKAQRDSKLLSNAVELRLRNGESLSDAVSGAAKDLYGDVKPVTGNSRVNAHVLIPSDQDETTVLSGLQSVLPDVKSAIETAMPIPPSAKASDGSLAVATAARENRISDILLNGYFRNMGDGYAFFDAYTGTAIAGKDGSPMIFREGDFKPEAPAPAELPPAFPGERAGDYVGKLVQPVPLQSASPQGGTVSAPPAQDTVKSKIQQDRRELFDNAKRSGFTSPSAQDILSGKDDVFGAR